MDTFPVAEDLLRSIKEGRIPRPVPRYAPLAELERGSMPSVNQGPELLGEDALEGDVPA